MAIKLLDYQEAGLRCTMDKNKVAYYWDMGLGKTFVGSEKLMSLVTKNNLLICQKSKIDDWVQHFADYYKYDISAYDLTKKPQWIDFWENPAGFKYQIGIINYELSFRRSELLKLKGFTLMLDESSLIKNETAKRSKFVLELNKNAENIILLSGTPTDGKYEKLWSQINLLGWDISKELYWKQYIDTEKVEYNGFITNKVVGYKNVDRLKEKLREHGANFLKSDEVLSLPEQIFQKVYVPTSKEYSKFLKTKITTIGEIELVGDTSLTKLLYLRMLCGQYNKDKLETFKDLISSSEKRFIVFYNFKQELEQLRQIADKLEKPISEVNGQVKNLENYNQYENTITFIQYQAGAMGLNLQKANQIVYFTLPQSSELFEQSKKRIHRVGQSSSCFYYYLLCKNSIEEKILETLEMRKDYTDELFRKEF